MIFPDRPMLWHISVLGAPGGRAIIWSERYKSNEQKALEKYQKLSGFSDKEISAHMIICPIDRCWNFATELLGSEELVNIVPNELWVVLEVELCLGDNLHVNTVCPMCEKHARRFRRSIRERIFRLEELVDILQKTIKEIEYEQWT